MATVFITGAAKNTGLAIAYKFAENGFEVAISSRNGEEAKKAATQISQNYNIRAKGYGLELHDINGIRQVFHEIKEDFGGLDVFVPNAADLGVGQDILTVTEEEYDQVMNSNIKGTYFCCQQAALIMKERQKGSIVIIGSVHYKQAIWGRSLYAASKGALASFTRSAAFELGRHGIRINYIVAGAIKTNRWDTLTEDEIAKKRINWPLGLESTGEDIANGAFYLGTDLSKTVTGTDLTIDSGVGICLLPYNGGK